MALLLWKQWRCFCGLFTVWQRRAVAALHVQNQPSEMSLFFFLPIEEVCMCVVLWLETLIWKLSANNQSKMSHSLWSACKNKKPFLSTYRRVNLMMCLLSSPQGRDWGFLWGSQSSSARGQTLAPPSCPPEEPRGWACAPACGRSEPWTCHDRTRGFASTAGEGRRQDRCCPEEVNHHTNSQC